MKLDKNIKNGFLSQNVFVYSLSFPGENSLSSPLTRVSQVFWV